MMLGRAGSITWALSDVGVKKVDNRLPKKITTKEA